MDEEILKALGAADQLKQAASMEKPPGYLLTLLKNGPGNHIRNHV